MNSAGKNMMIKIRQSVIEKYPTSVEFIRANSFDNCNLRYFNIKTIAQAFNSQSLKFAQLAHIYSPVAKNHFIESWLIQYARYLGMPFDNYQVVELGKILVELLNPLNLAEITMFFRDLRTGRFGQFYNRIDPISITLWLKEFKTQRGIYLSKLPSDEPSQALLQAKAEYEQRKGAAKS